MNYDKILEDVLFADSKEEIDQILRNTISKLRETCVEISDDEKTEFVLKLINLRKRLGLTKEITTITGLRALVRNIPNKDYAKLSEEKAESSNVLYGVFTEGNQFFIAEDVKVKDSYADWQLKNYYNNQRFVYDAGGLIKNYEGIWPNTSSKLDEKIFVVRLSKIIGSELSNPYTEYLHDVLFYVNDYLSSDPNFVKKAFGESKGKLLIKYL